MGNPLITHSHTQLIKNSANGDFPNVILPSLSYQFLVIINFFFQSFVVLSIIYKIMLFFLRLYFFLHFFVFIVIHCFLSFLSTFTTFFFIETHQKNTSTLQARAILSTNWSNMPCSLNFLLKYFKLSFKTNL